MENDYKKRTGIFVIYLKKNIGSHSKHYKLQVF